MARTAKTKRLTALQVRRYAEGPPSAPPLHDGGGLYLRRRESGSYWYLRLSEPGTGVDQWHRLFPNDPEGGYPSKSLADARLEAERLWSLRSEGKDPRAERERAIQAQRAADEAEQAARRRRITLRELFERWAEADLQPRLRADGKRVGRKDGGAYTRAQFERHVFKTLGDSVAADIGKADLLGILDAQKAAGKLRTANTLLADLKQMFAFALDREIVQRNPLDTVKKRQVGGASVARDRVLDPEEIAKLAEALPGAGMDPRSVAAVWLMLATGARIGEAMGAVWADTPGLDRNALLAQGEQAGVKTGFVDLVARTWHLPDTKNQRDHTIHLSEFALAQFSALAKLREQECARVAELAGPSTAPPWVFPNVSRDGPVCVKSLGKQLADRQRPPERRMKNRSKHTQSLVLPGGRWTAHDLRRTAGTLMARLGVSGDVIDECLNHMIQSSVRRVYVRDRREADQARAFDALGNKLMEIVEGRRLPDNVRLLAAA